MKPRLLVVVDTQKDFIDGALGTKEAVAIVKNVQKKFDDYFQNSQNRFIFTKDTHIDEEYFDSIEGKHLPVKHCILDTEGHNIAIKYLGAHPNVFTVEKYNFGYMNYENSIEDFFGTEILKSLDVGDMEIELVGLCTDICVISNALILKATFPNTEVYVDASCCAGVTPELHKEALDVMRSCHVNIIGEENESE